MLHVELRVPRARKMSKDHVELLRQLAEAENDSIDEDSGVLKKVKDLFA